MSKSEAKASSRCEGGIEGEGEFESEVSFILRLIGPPATPKVPP
jgi:hypothetical protein